MIFKTSILLFYLFMITKVIAGESTYVDKSCEKVISKGEHHLCDPNAQGDNYSCGEKQDCLNIENVPGFQTIYLAGKSCLASGKTNALNCQIDQDCCSGKCLKINSAKNSNANQGYCAPTFTCVDQISAGEQICGVANCASLELVEGNQVSLQSMTPDNGYCVKTASAPINKLPKIVGEFIPGGAGEKCLFQIDEADQIAFHQAQYNVVGFEFLAATTESNGDQDLRSHLSKFAVHTQEKRLAAKLALKIKIKEIIDGVNFTVSGAESGNTPPPMPLIYSGQYFLNLNKSQMDSVDWKKVDWTSFFYDRCAFFQKTPGAECFNYLMQENVSKISKNLNQSFVQKILNVSKNEMTKEKKDFLKNETWDNSFSAHQPLVNPLSIYSAPFESLSKIHQAMSEFELENLKIYVDFKKTNTTTSQTVIEQNPNMPIDLSNNSDQIIMTSSSSGLEWFNKINEEFSLTNCPETQNQAIVNSSTPATAKLSQSLNETNFVETGCQVNQCFIYEYGQPKNKFGLYDPFIPAALKDSIAKRTIRLNEQQSAPAKNGLVLKEIFQLQKPGVNASKKDQPFTFKKLKFVVENYLHAYDLPQNMMPTKNDILDALSQHDKYTLANPNFSHFAHTLSPSSFAYTKNIEKLFYQFAGSDKKCDSLPIDRQDFINQITANLNTIAIFHTELAIAHEKSAKCFADTLQLHSIPPTTPVIAENGVDVIGSTTIDKKTTSDLKLSNLKSSVILQKYQQATKKFLPVNSNLENLYKEFNTGVSENNVDR
jgi:hypothetical protein